MIIVTKASDVCAVSVWSSPSADWLEHARHGCQFSSSRANELMMSNS